MQSKLTLRLDSKLIARAKAWADARGVSLSQAVAALFEQVAGKPDTSLTPWTRKLVGLAARKGRAPSDAALRSAHLDHLAAKHR